MESATNSMNSNDATMLPVRAGLSDTAVEAQRVWDDMHRRMPIQRKWQLIAQSQCMARQLVAAGRLYRGQDPAAGDESETTMSQAGEPLSVMREVVAALDTLGITYALGGSMASSLFGVPRFTQVADLTVVPFPGREQALADCFSADRCYASVPAMQDANRRRSSFNIIDTTAGFKVDLFVRNERAFEQTAMSRRMALTLPDRPAQLLYVLSPEDVVLFKLEWYRLGNETSERQWLDVQNVLRVQRDTLDREYLTRWAADLKIDDLLLKAWTDAER